MRPFEISEFNAPTRADIKGQLEAVRNHPANRGLSKAALRTKQRDSLQGFLQGRGLRSFEIENILTDVESYYPESFSAVGRQV